MNKASCPSWWESGLNPNYYSVTSSKMHAAQERSQETQKCLKNRVAAARPAAHQDTPYPVPHNHRRVLLQRDAKCASRCLGEGAHCFLGIGQSHVRVLLKPVDHAVRVLMISLLHAAFGLNRVRAARESNNAPSTLGENTDDFHACVSSFLLRQMFQGVDADAHVYIFVSKWQRRGVRHDRKDLLCCACFAQAVETHVQRDDAGGVLFQESSYAIRVGADLEKGFRRDAVAFKTPYNRNVSQRPVGVPAAILFRVCAEPSCEMLKHGMRPSASEL